MTTTSATETMFCGCDADGPYCATHVRAEASRLAKQNPRAKANSRSLIRMVIRIAA